MCAMRPAVINPHRRDELACGLPRDVCDTKFIGVLTFIALAMLLVQLTPHAAKNFRPQSARANASNGTEDMELDGGQQAAAADQEGALSTKEWASLERERADSACAASRYATRREEYYISNTSLSQLSPGEIITKMRKFCAKRPRAMTWGPGQFIGFSAYGQHMMCIRGRSVIAEFPRTSAGGAAVVQNTTDEGAPQEGDADATQQLPTSGASTLRMAIVRGTMRWKQNRVSVKVKDFNHEAFEGYTGRVVVSDALGVVSSVFLQAFHIHTNVWLPLIPVLATQTNSRGHLNREIPELDVLLYRELPQGAKLKGGENFSVWMAAAVANGRVGITARLDGLEDQTTTYCYCDGVLHNMADVITMRNSQRIAEGDAVRREATVYIKRRINRQLGFLPYGSYPIPVSEYIPYGLWTNDTSKGPTAPRLLFFLRRRTRTLEGVPDILQMALGAGFNVHVMFAEDHSYEIQARAARYADVIMAVHGQAMVWLLMMDGIKASNCRSIIELQYFGVPLKGYNNVYEVMSADSHLRYYGVPAAAAIFTGASCSVANKFCANWGAAMLHTNSPTTHPGFHNQSVFPNHMRLGNALKRVYAKVSECVVKNTPVALSYFDLARSSMVKNELRKKKKGAKKR